MTDTPPGRERFLDARLLAAIGGVAVGATALVVATFLRVSDALNRAADDRVATALADTPASAQLLVVRAPSRAGDWMLGKIIQDLDSAGARAVGVAIDLSVAVAPTGTLPDLLTASPHAVIAVTEAGDSVAWPWFIPDSVRARGTNRVALTELLRDADGAVRLTRTTGGRAALFADRMAATMSGRASSFLPSAPMHLRFARADTVWYGVPSISLDSALAMPAAGLQKLVSGRTVLLGIDDGRTVPTSVGAMPPLAVIAHEVNSRSRIALQAERALSDASLPVTLLWLLLWVIAGAAITAVASLGTTVLLAIGAVVSQAALALWSIEATGIWLPLGTAMLGFLMAMAGAETISLWQARRRQRLTSLLFSRFVTPALANDAWNARHLYLQGGRPAPLQLPVTVLFIDLRGFTRFSEANAASDVMQLLTDVTAACASDIAAHGGLVDDFAGDGIKADFGVPVPRRGAAEIASDAMNAVNCAQALAKTIERLLPGSIGNAGTRARIGVHSGTAVAGTIGGSTRLKYTVVGDVVNVAARLQSVELTDDGDAAAVCRIVVSAATMALLDANAPAASDLGLLTLTGRDQPVQAYRLRPAASPSH